MPHRQHRHAEPAFDRDQLVVLRFGLGVPRIEDHRLRRAVDIGIDQPDLVAGTLERDREIGGERRFAHAALARSHRDQAARGPLGSLDHLDLVHVLSLRQSLGQFGFDPRAPGGVQTGGVEHHQSAPLDDAGRLDPCRQSGGKRCDDIGFGHG